MIQLEQRTNTVARLIARGFFLQLRYANIEGGTTVRPLLAATILFVTGCASMESKRQTDNIALPFVEHPQVIGQWKSVDFVAAPDQFSSGKKYWQGDLFLKELDFQADGKTSKPWWTWTKGVLIHHGDKTASKYFIKHEGNASYMFLEWKSGDYIIRKMKPAYYVLKKAK